MSKELPCPDILRNLLRYEPDTGKLFWLPRHQGFFDQSRHWLAWNTRYSGMEAFTTINDNGYCQGDIFNRKHAAHRVAWAIFYGESAQGPVDHINGIRSDNRIENLRLASPMENSRNCASARGSSSRFLGVSWHKGNKKWSAQIRVNRCQKHLGYFKDEESAAAAYIAAAKAYFGEFARCTQG
jgi:hypothetical protein